MTCAKRVVHCHIITTTGEIVHGTNNCINPQEVCPREKDEGYDKCKSICLQEGHAEEVAIKIAKEKGLNILGGTAYVSGHWNVCKNCSRHLRDAGIAKIILDVSL